MKLLRTAATALAAGALAVLGAGPPASAQNAAPASARNSAAQKKPVMEAFWLGSPAADQLPMDRLNTITYAFASPAGGRCSAPTDTQRADLESLEAVKAKHPGTTVLVSIGGWGAPGFGAGAATAASRRTFADSCIDQWMSAFPAGLVDGFDIDWEFPVSGGLPSIGSSPADRKNLNLLLGEFRSRLTAHARAVHRDPAGMKLSIDLPAGRTQDDGTGSAGAPYDQSHSYDLPAVGRLVDLVNLMTYDLCTGYSKVSCFNDPLVQRKGDPNDRWNNNAGALQYMTQHGVPAGKIVLGVPFYGRWFTVDDTKNGGLYRPYSATSTIDYTTVTGPDWAGNPDFVKGWDPVVKSPYLWNAKTRTWVNYEDPRSIGIRATFARTHRLAGMMMWHVGLDTPDHSLVDAMTAPWLKGAARR